MAKNPTETPTLKVVSSGDKVRPIAARPAASEAIVRFRNSALQLLAEHAPEDLQAGALVLITEKRELALLFGFTTLEQATTLLGGLEGVRFKVAQILDSTT